MSLVSALALLDFVHGCGVVHGRGFFRMAPKAPPVFAEFKMISEKCPEFLPLTPRGQEFYGQLLKVPPENRSRVARRPVFCLPQKGRMVQYMEWFETHAAKPPGVYIMMTTPELWIEEFGMEAYRECLIELQNKGRPTVHWRHMAYCDTDD